MPLYPDAEAKIEANLRMIEAGNRAPLIAIGEFTDRQVAAIEAERRGPGLHEIANKESVLLAGIDTPAGPRKDTPSAIWDGRSKVRLSPTPS